MVISLSEQKRVRTRPSVAGLAQVKKCWHTLAIVLGSLHIYIYIYMFAVFRNSADFGNGISGRSRRRSDKHGNSFQFFGW